MPTNPADQPGPSQGPKPNEAKKAVLTKALDDIIKRYGKGSILRQGEAKHM